MTDYEKALRLLDAAISSADCLSEKEANLKELRLDILKNGFPEEYVFAHVQVYLIEEDKDEVRRKSEKAWNEAILWILTSLLAIGILTWILNV